MPEITEHDENPTGTEPASQNSDTNSIRTIKPGLKRLFLTLSVFLSFLLGFPLLWKSVEIYRSPLPFNDMDTLSNQIDSNPPSFPCHFQAIFINSSNSNPRELKSSILTKIAKLRPQNPICGSCINNFTLSVTFDSFNTGCTQSVDTGPDCLYKCGSIRALDFGDDEGVDEDLESVLGDRHCYDGKVYTVVVVEERVDAEEMKVVVGKYRHAWIVGRELSEEAVVGSLVEIFVKVFVNGGKEGFVSAEFMPVGADGRIVLSFSLLNSNPHDWVYDWDFKKVDDTMLAPIVEALKPIANISVESQVLYHTPKSSFSAWSDKLKGYTFTTKDLPFFVNSNEWHFDTSIAAGGRTKILQFVVYVSSQRECPLLLELPNGQISTTSGFISPMWGGVMVWNPATCERTLESKARHIISDQDMEKVFEVFMGQLRQLFGLKSPSHYVGLSGKYKLLPSRRGFTHWELDVLSRQHTCFNLQSSAATLGSLSRLVQSLPRMIIMDEIGKQVKFSLEAARLAQNNASLGVYSASAVSSRQARSLAEDAFFHPSIMSVSYYSFEHCFAVYSPFFLPVSMHVILAILREWKRYKQENMKYLQSKVKVKSA